MPCSQINFWGFLFIFISSTLIKDAIAFLQPQKNTYHDQILLIRDNRRLIGQVKNIRSSYFQVTAVNNNLEVKEKEKKINFDSQYHDTKKYINAQSNASDTTIITEITNLLKTEESTIPSLQLYKKALTAYGNLGDYQGFLKVYDHMIKNIKDIDVVSYNSAISACAKMNQYRKASEIFKKMDKEPNLITYKSLITSCKKSSQWSQLLKFFLRIKSSDADLKMDRSLYNSAMKACAKLGKWQEALSIIHEMERIGIIPDVVCYNTAISACARGRKFEKAFDVIASMKSYNVQPNKVTFNAALKACLIQKEVDMGSELVSEMKFKEIEMDRITLITLIKLHSITQDWDQVGALIKEMKLKGMQMDIDIYNHLINALTPSKRLKDIANMEIFNGMKEENPILPNVKTYNLLIDSYNDPFYYSTKEEQPLLKNQDIVENAISFLEKMKAEKLKPDMETYYNIIRICQKCKDWNKAIDIMTEMKSEYGLNPQGQYRNFEQIATKCYKEFQKKLSSKIQYINSSSSPSLSLGG